jgi:hypothetical protein
MRNKIGLLFALVSLLAVSAHAQCRSASAWWTQALTPVQSGNFTVTFDVTPPNLTSDTVVGFAGGATAPTTYTGLAGILRLSDTGIIQAMNGAGPDTYQPPNSTTPTAPPYALKAYHIQMDVRSATHAYDLYYTPSGGVKTQLAQNFLFRSGSATITSVGWIGGATGNGTAQVCNITVTPAIPPTVPTITAQPAPQNVFVGKSATFSVAASNATTYQWSKTPPNTSGPTTPITGATSPSYSTPATVQADNQSTFTVAVTNSVGTVTSSSALLTVNPYVGTADAGQTIITTWQPADSAMGGCGSTLTCSLVFTVGSGNTGIAAVVGLTTTVKNVGLAWNWTSSNVSGQVPPTQFNVYRSTTTGTGYHQIGTVPYVAATPPTFTDTTPVHGTTYFYVVTAAAPAASCINSTTNQPEPCESVFSNESSILFP